MRKTHKKTCRNKRKTQTRRRKGGVGTQGQAEALQQVFNSINRSFAQDEIAEILAHQSYEAMGESVRRQARENAKNMARTARREHHHEDGTRKSNLRQILGRTHLVEPDLEERLLRQSRPGPSQATLRSLRERGTHVSRDNRQAYDDKLRIRRANKMAIDRAMLQRYGPPPPGGYDLRLPLVPVRQMAERGTPFDRFET